MTRSYRLETAEKLKQVEELTDTEHPKVFHVTRCAICKAQLDLPALHFMCNHSYHQRCVIIKDSSEPLTDEEKSIGVYRKMTKNVQTALGNTVLYGRYGVIMRNWPINMMFSWQKYRRKGLRLLPVGLVVGF